MILLLVKGIFNKSVKICVICGLVFLFLSSSALADLSFLGGNMTGQTTVNPTQNLQILPGRIIGTQGLTNGDLMSLATTGMTGIVAGNQYLTRSVSGNIGKSILDRQVTSGTTAQASHSAGLQNTAATFMISSSDMVELRGNGGNIRFDSARGADPSITFNTFNQETNHAAPATGPSMTQRDNITATILSPGTAAAPLSLVATGNASGRVAFASSIVGQTARDQELSGLLAGGAGIYNGQMADSSFISMESYTEMGTIP